MICVTPTAVSVLREMEAPDAARLLSAMGTERAVGLLVQASPTSVADILRSVPPASRQVLVESLPEPLCSLVSRSL